MFVSHFSVGHSANNIISSGIGRREAAAEAPPTGRDSVGGPKREGLIGHWEWCGDWMIGLDVKVGSRTPPG